jgi:hypothetical protein
MGPTVIAVALMILVIGIGWLNHSGDDFVDSSSPLGRELIEAQADQANGADIPAAGAALPGSLGGSAATGTDGGTTGTTLQPSVLDILLGEPTVTGTGSESAAGAGSTGSSGSSASSGSGSSGTTSPSSPGTRPTTTSGSPSTTGGTTPPSSDTTVTTESTTTTDSTEPPPPIEDAGLLDVVGGLLGGVVGVLA